MFMTLFMSFGYSRYNYNVDYNEGLQNPHAAGTMHDAAGVALHAVSLALFYGRLEMGLPSPRVLLWTQ